MDGTTTSAIIDTRRYIPAVTLSTQDNTSLLEQVKSVCKRTINLNNYQSIVSTQAQNKYLFYLIDSSFQGVCRPFALLFENNAVRKEHTEYVLPKVEIKAYNG